ncbi:MAG TPA: hypothetical protein VG456_18830 [Candidatus Sulfopaludibacter sp.]|jgi:hypothetical protein|nr:hypothetical protein [Candidatus Sulfopaludibacter sp.]
MARSFGWMVLAGMAAASAVGRAPAQERSSSVKIRMSLDGDRFLARESILLKIELENTGSSPVEVPSPEDLRNPQFSYHITGPQFPEGMAFKPRITLPDPNKPTFLKIAAGQTGYVQQPLNLMFGLTQAGRYTLTARYAWKGSSESFGPISFSIDAGSLGSAQVMADDGFQKAARLRVLGLVGNPPVVYQFFFQEARPQLGEIKFVDMMRAAKAPANARTVVAPWTNFNRANVFFARYGWQAPGAMGLEAGMSGDEVRVALPPDAAVIAPALMPKDGTATVFARTPSSLMMARLPLPPNAGSVQWTAPVTTPIRGAAAALGLAPRNQTFVVTVSQTAQGAELRLYDGEGAGKSRTAEVKSGRVLPDSEPALWVDEKGGAHAAVLLAEDNLMHRVFLAEVTWDGGEGKVQRWAAEQLPRASTASVVAYGVTAAGRGRSSWALLLDDGTMVSNVSRYGPYRPNRPPVLPLQLVGMETHTYLMVADPVDFVGFEMLR